MRKEAYELTKEFLETVNAKENALIAIGCSTSEITGNKIGTSSKPEVAEEVFLGIYEALNERNVFLAAQCCEHLNRALIVERELAEKKGYEIVSVVPYPKAGGSFATMAYKYMKDPVAVEYVKADLGMDIGDTLVGMHLKHVAVPVRISKNILGDARVIFASTRPKFIGGERAKYTLYEN